MIETIWRMILDNKNRYELIDERQDLEKENGVDAMYVYLDTEDGTYLYIGFTGIGRKTPSHIEFHKTF